MSALTDLQKRLHEKARPEKVELLAYFFKSGPGQYGEGDQFLGVVVPDVRKVAKEYRGVSRTDVTQLLTSAWHEERLCALLILVDQFAAADKKSDEKTQRTIYDLYLSKTKNINNWDLVDLSCRDIIGAFVYKHPDEYPTLIDLTGSSLLWDRRIAIVSTYYFLKQGDPSATLEIAKLLLSDKEDLIQKAVGWMLREMGKRVDRDILVDFLRKNYDQIPRTTLRYAIEHFDKATRARFLRGDYQHYYL